MSVQADSAPDAPEIGVETPFQRFRSEFFESWIAAFALGLLGLIVVLALLAPWITPQNPYDLAQVDVMDGKLPPGSVPTDARTSPATFLRFCEGILANTNGRATFSSAVWLGCRLKA